MTTATPLPGTATQLTFAVQGLASDANLLAGRASTAIDCASLDAFDILIGGRIRTGTTQVTGRQFGLFAYCSYDGSEYTGGFSGTDGNASPSDLEGLELFRWLPTIATNDKDYHFGMFSFAQAFGGWLPPKVGLFLVHNTNVNLNATGTNHKFWYVAQKAESA